MLYDMVKYWRLAIRQLYTMDYITEKQYLIMYDRSFYNTINDNSYDSKNIKLAIDVMSNKSLFKHLLQKEAQLLITVELPINKQEFKVDWLAHLLDSYELRLISLDEFNDLRYSIDFSNPIWEDDEKELVEYLINKIRLFFVQKQPSGIEHLENPTFDMLMSANEMVNVND